MEAYRMQQINSLSVKPGRLTSFLKWAGGKEQELKYIIPLLPTFTNYYEPFVGGGAVFFSIDARQKFINDKSSELVNLYRQIAQQSEVFFALLDALASAWQQIGTVTEQRAASLVGSYQAYSRDFSPQAQMASSLDAFLQEHNEQWLTLCSSVLPQEHSYLLHELRRNLLSKTKRMKRLEQIKGQLPECDVYDNLECALKSAFYMYLRHVYNHRERYALSDEVAAAVFFFMRENAYAAMFRYNREGRFNVPYGGISYNRKDIGRKITYMRSPELRRHLDNTIIENLDFEVFFQRHVPTSADFVFLDPPYDSEFSTYAQNEFTLRDQQRLAEYLLHYCAAQFLLVIKNTPAIQQLYMGKGLRISSFDKRYVVSFQDRNNREARHLLITNFS